MSIDAFKTGGSIISTMATERGCQRKHSIIRHHLFMDMQTENLLKSATGIFFKISQSNKPWYFLMYMSNPNRQ